MDSVVNSSCGPPLAETVAASSGAGDDVKIVSRAELKPRLKERLRTGRLLRVKSQLQNSKPGGASPRHWTYFQCYTTSELEI